MSADPIAFYILRSTQRTNEDVFNALNALDLWCDFFPDTYEDFLAAAENSTYANKGYALFYKLNPVYDQVEEPHNQVGVVVNLLIDRTDDTKLPIQARKQQLINIFKQLPMGNPALLPEHLGEIPAANVRQLDGTNHLVVVKLPKPPHEYAGNVAPDMTDE
jgi:hypothetical protein